MTSMLVCKYSERMWRHGHRLYWKGGRSNQNGRACMWICVTDAVKDANVPRIWKKVTYMILHEQWWCRQLMSVERSEVTLVLIKRSFYFELTETHVIKVEGRIGRILSQLFLNAPQRRFIVESSRSAQTEQRCIICASMAALTSEKRWVNQPKLNRVKSRSQFCWRRETAAEPRL